MYSRWRFKKSHVHFVYFYNYLLCFTTHLKMQYHGDKGDKDLKKHESMTEKALGNLLEAVNIKEYILILY